MEPTRRTDPPPIVSVVTAVHSNVEELDGLLDALRRQQPLGTLTEVIIVDNHRRPQLPEDFGDETIPACTVRVVHESTLGLGRARNAGVRAATGTYVLITDPDSRPRERWVHELVTAMSESGAFCVGGRTVADFRESGRTHADVSAQVLGQFVPLSWPARRTTLHEPYWLIGCNLGFRRRPEALFHEALGVTGKRHLSCEDLEFVIRAQIAGEHVVVVPEAVVGQHRRARESCAPGSLRRAVTGRRYEVYLNKHLTCQGTDVQMYLCDLNPQSQPSTSWPFPTVYLEYEALYSDPQRLVPELKATLPTSW
ncbi:hypothetical protein SALBM311S_05418 [Streptomyces alboniger]